MEPVQSRIVESGELARVVRWILKKDQAKKGSRKRGPRVAAYQRRHYENAEKKR